MIKICNPNKKNEDFLKNYSGDIQIQRKDLIR